MVLRQLNVLWQLHKSALNNHNDNIDNPISNWTTWQYGVGCLYNDYKIMEITKSVMTC